jgi:translation initiation factor 5B
MALRQSICVFVGHVDHGKTSILDKIRNTVVASKEAGAITQHTSASEVPKEILLTICKKQLEQMKLEIKLPGILFIDTPGHEAFTSLRERGGSLADLAVLVIDINQGIQPQTIESIKILKQKKTPFIIAANKIDLLMGWNPKKDFCFMESYKQQTETTKDLLDQKIYEIVGKMYEYGFDTERFDRVQEMTKQILIIPMSAKTGEGLAELLLYISGISQKYLEKNLNIEVKGKGKGSILEIKEEKGLGTTIDVIIYDGSVKKGDEFLFGTLKGVKKTKIRGILKPTLPGQHIKDKFIYVDEVHAASGFKIFAPELEDAIPGSPFLIIEDEEKQTKEIEEQLKKVLFESEGAGVIIKTDTLGSTEALIKMLSGEKINIKQAGIGKITKTDIIGAKAVRNMDKYLGAILGFNVSINEDAKEEAKEEDIPIFESNVVYNLIDKYKEWAEEEKQRDKDSVMKGLVWPVKIRILRNHIFRVSKPAVFGVEILGGKLRPGFKMINEKGIILGEIKVIQDKGENIKEAKKGMQVAVSMEKPIAGKDFNEEDVLYSYINRETASTIKTHFSDELTEEEKALLKEITDITIMKYF